MAGITTGELSVLMQPQIAKLDADLYSNETIVWSELFEDGVASPPEDDVQYGASEIKWQSGLGRSIAGGARFATERLPSTVRTVGTATEFRGELPFAWLSEPFAHYFAQVYVDLAVQDAGPLGQAARKQAMTAYRIQRRAAEMIVKKMSSWHHFGPVNNALAVVNVAVAVAATSFVARRNDVVANAGQRGAYCLGRGVVFVVIDPATGTVRGAAGYRVTSVVVAAAGDTVNFLPAVVAAGAWSAGDVVVEGDANSNSFGRGILSLPALVGNAVDSEIIHGQSRVQHPQLSATIMPAPAAAFRGAAIDFFERTIATARARGSVDTEPYTVICAPGLAAEFMFAGGRVDGGIAINAGQQPAQELVRYTQGASVEYGFTSMTMLFPSAPGGRAKLLTDPDATPNTAFVIRRRDFRKWVQQKPGWGPGTILDAEGHRLENFYRGYATLHGSCAITCHNLPVQAAIRGMIHTNILVAQGGEGAAATVA